MEGEAKKLKSEEGDLSQSKCVILSLTLTEVNGKPCNVDLLKAHEGPRLLGLVPAKYFMQ